MQVSDIFLPSLKKDNVIMKNGERLKKFLDVSNRKLGKLTFSRSIKSKSYVHWH